MRWILFFLPLFSADYPGSDWKALTTYVDKPTFGDVTGDGLPEIIGTSVFGDVFCVNAKTGQLLWTYEDEHSFEMAIYICPAVADLEGDGIAEIISVTPRGTLVCLDGRTGMKRWAWRCSGATAFSPVLFTLDTGSRAIAVTDLNGNLSAVDARGALLWRANIEVQPYGAPALVKAGGETMLVVADRAGSLRSYAARDGRVLWTSSLGESPISTSPLAVNGRIAAGTEMGEVFLVEAQNGRQVWMRSATGEAAGDFSAGDLNGDGRLELVYSTSDGRVIALRESDGKEVWNRKFKLPVKEYVDVNLRKRVGRDILAGEAVLADGDGDGRLDVIFEARGLNNYVYCLRGSDGRTLWRHGAAALFDNPAVDQTTVIATFQPAGPLTSFSTTVPVYSQPTPVVADFDRDGRLELIINDRDEVGLIRMPLKGAAGTVAWPKYRSGPGNNPE
jgi:outer membrane protein assembly factor BamB